MQGLVPHRALAQAGGESSPLGRLALHAGLDLEQAEAELRTALDFKQPPRLQRNVPLSPSAATRMAREASLARLRWKIQSLTTTRLSRATTITAKPLLKSAFIPQRDTLISPE